MKTLLIFAVFIGSLYSVGPCFAGQSSITVCFSPNGNCDEKLITLFDSAKLSLDVAIYSINREDIAEKLISLSKKIKVRVICDKLQAAGKTSLVATLLKAGVPIRYGHQRGIMHDKFSLVDGKQLETGSYNYTDHATLANQENELFISDPVTVGIYATHFEQMWASSIEIVKAKSK